MKNENSGFFTVVFILVIGMIGAYFLFFAEKDFSEFVSKEDDFAVSFPEIPEFQGKNAETVPDMFGVESRVYSYVQQNEFGLGVAVVEFPLVFRMVSDEEKQKKIEDEVERVLMERGIEYQTGAVEYGGIRGGEFVLFDADGDFGRVFFTTAGNRVYFVGYLYEKGFYDEKLQNDFFGSFRIGV